MRGFYILIQSMAEEVVCVYCTTLPVDLISLTLLCSPIYTHTLDSSCINLRPKFIFFTHRKLRLKIDLAVAISFIGLSYD